MYSHGLGQPVTEREVSQVDCVRVGPLQDSGQVPRGAFPAEGAA